MSYVSKLRSGQSYRATSRGPTDSRVLSASAQNPFLLPPVLNILLPRLTFNDLKKCRLVCSTWNALVIPLIARRQLHPVEFSAISHQDFLALKSEFLKFPGKVQFFQGFQVKWDQISGMVWSNFLASFKPRALVISGGDVTDPWTNLSQLLAPVTSTLTRLSLEFHCHYSHSCNPITKLLKNLANLEPLTLKSLSLRMSQIMNGHLTIFDLHDLKFALEKLFQRHSRTLEELKLIFTWVVSTADNFQDRELSINLPILPSLRILDLNLMIMDHEDHSIYQPFPILAPFDFNIQFPQLLEFKVLDSLLNEMMPGAIDLTRGHPLKKLKIYFSEEQFTKPIGLILQALYSSFPHLEEFIDPESSFILLIGGIQIPWVETLRALEVAGICNFNFCNFKKLEDLKYRVCLGGQNLEIPIPSLIQLISEHLHQLPHLKSFHLAFEEMSDETMDEIREGVSAEFRDILTIDLID